MTTKKIGRPTTNPRTESMSLRLSKKEKELITEVANKMNISRVDVIVKGVELLDDSLK